MAKDDMHKLKLKLAEMSPTPLPEDLMDEFLGEMTEVRLNTYDIISPAGVVDNNIYICKEGIVRYVYKSGHRSITQVFAPPGNILISWHSYCHGLPAFYQMEACCKHTVVLKMSREKFDSFIDRYHVFSKWLITLYQRQLFFFEQKISAFNGDARHRFEMLLQTRPEIMNQVPLGVIASYLAITPQYLSTLRKQLAIKGRTTK